MTNEEMVALCRIWTLIDKYSEEATWRAMAAAWGVGQREWLLELNELRSLCFRYPVLRPIWEGLPRCSDMEGIYGYTENADGSPNRAPRKRLQEGEVQGWVTEFGKLRNLFVESWAKRDVLAASDTSNTSETTTAGTIRKGKNCWDVAYQQLCWVADRERREIDELLASPTEAYRLLSQNWAEYFESLDKAQLNGPHSKLLCRSTWCKYITNWTGIRRGEAVDLIQRGAVPA